MTVFPKSHFPVCGFLVLALAIAVSSSFAQESVDGFEDLLRSLDEEAMRVPKDAAYHLEMKQLLLETREALEAGDLSGAAWRVDQMKDWNRPAIRKEFAKMGYLMMEEKFRAAADQEVEETFGRLEKLIEETVATVRTAGKEADLLSLEAEIERFANSLQENSWIDERLGERFDDRLFAVSSLVENMSDFFAAKEVGDESDALKSLDIAARMAVGQPVFTMGDYEQHVRSLLPGLHKIFDRDPSEIGAMAMEFEKWKPGAPAALAEEIEELEENIGTMVEADREAKAGRLEHAVEIWNTLNARSQRLGREQIGKTKEYHIRKLFAEIASEHTGTALQDAESVEVFLMRALAAEAEEEDYESFLALVRLYRLIGMKADIPRWMGADEAGVAAYVRAARFLEAGDPTAAIPHLRRVVSEIDGKYTPVEKAASQLKAALAAVESPPPVVED